MKENKTLTCGYYTAQFDNTQTLDRWHWCSKCLKFVPADRASSEQYHIGYIDHVGKIRVAAYRRIGLDCGHPLDCGTQDMKIFAMIQAEPHVIARR